MRARAREREREKEESAEVHIRYCSGTCKIATRSEIRVPGSESRRRERLFPFHEHSPKTRKPSVVERGSCGLFGIAIVSLILSLLPDYY